MSTVHQVVYHQQQPRFASPLAASSLPSSFLAASPLPPPVDDWSRFWFDNFQHGEQVELSSFIQALVLHFNERLASPLFILLPLPSQRRAGAPTFLPFMLNSLLFLCIPDLASALSASPPSDGSEGGDGDGESRCHFLRRHQVELFVRTFGGQLRTAFHLAHFTLFDHTGAVFPWFHGHDQSFERAAFDATGEGSEGGAGAFLVRFSHAQPGSLVVWSVVKGHWSKAYLTCTREGWSACTAKGSDGPSTPLGLFDSVHSYLALHHAQQTPIPSTACKLFTSTLAPSEAALPFHPPQPFRPSSPTFSDPIGAGTGEHSDDSTAFYHHLSATSAHLTSATAKHFPTSPSPALSSYQLLTSYPIVLGAASADKTGNGAEHVELPDSLSRASTVVSSASPSSPLQSDELSSSADVEMSSAAADGVEEGGLSAVPTEAASKLRLQLFFYAIAVGDVLAVETLIRLRCVPLTSPDEFGLTCVHVACAFNRVRILHLLKAVVPITMLAAVTMRRISHRDEDRLAAHSPLNRFMPYFRTSLVLETGSPCGSVACGYQSGGCLAFIQGWLSEHGVHYESILAQKA